MWSWLMSLFGPDKRSPEGLVQQLNSPKPEVRTEALKTLATVKEPWAVGVLLPFLGHPDATLSAAVRADLLARGAAIVPAVSTRIDRSDPATAKQLLELLADLKIAEAVPVLLQALKFSTRPTQLVAKQALIRTGTVAVPALEACDEANPWVQKQIEDILAAVRANSA
jgi:HEAT repeat protein